MKEKETSSTRTRLRATYKVSGHEDASVTTGFYSDFAELKADETDAIRELLRLCGETQPEKKHEVHAAYLDIHGKIVSEGIVRQTFMRTEEE